LTFVVSTLLLALADRFSHRSRASEEDSAGEGV
jgi:hypothetical protein